MFILMQEGKVYKFYVDLRELHGNGFQFATTHKKIQSAMLFLVLSHVPDLCKVEECFLYGRSDYSDANIIPNQSVDAPEYIILFMRLS